MSRRCEATLRSRLCGRPWSSILTDIVGLQDQLQLRSSPNSAARGAVLRHGQAHEDGSVTAMDASSAC